MKVKFKTVSMESLVIQTQQMQRDILTYAVNGDLRLYLNQTNIESVARYEFDHDSGDYIFIGNQPTYEAVLPVNANLCREIMLNGSVTTKEFVSHSAFDKAILDVDVKICPEMLFAYLDEVNSKLTAKGKIKAEVHGNKLKVIPRNAKIYEVANQILQRDPKAFSFKTSYLDEEYKINGRSLSEFIYNNQKALFGKHNFIGVEFDTFHERIITRDGFKAGILPKRIKKTD